MRYEVHWGHTVGGRGGETIEVTRADYNRAFGQPVPDAPELPEVATEAWAAWMRLNSRRSLGENIEPISYERMEAFERMTGTILTTVDVRMIEAIDDGFIGQIKEERKAAQEKMQADMKAKQQRKRK